MIMCCGHSEVPLEHWPQESEVLRAERIVWSDFRYSTIQHLLLYYIQQDDATLAFAELREPSRVQVTRAR